MSFPFRDWVSLLLVLKLLEKQKGADPPQASCNLQFRMRGMVDEWRNHVR